MFFYPVIFWVLKVVFCDAFKVVEVCCCYSEGFLVWAPSPSRKLEYRILGSTNVTGDPL